MSMITPSRFISQFMQLNELPDSFSKEEVLELVSQALQHSLDARSDLDETRILALRKALGDIERTTTDALIAITAKRALVTDDE